MTQARITSKAVAAIRNLDARHAACEKMNAAVLYQLAAVNGRASSLTLTERHQLAEVCQEVENRLARGGVTGQAMVGTEIRYRPAGPYANSYKYAGISTAVRMVRIADGWRLASAIRTEVWPKQAEMREVTISEDAAAGLLARYTVRAEPPREAAWRDAALQTAG